MKDSVVRVTVIGLFGTLLMNATVYVLQSAGINIMSPWLIAANIFLTPAAAATPLGIAIGLIATAALNIASAGAVLLLLLWTGYDYAVLKGIIGCNALSFLTMGLFMPLLGISPEIRNRPLTNMAAFIILSVVGAIFGLLLKHFRVEVK